MIRSIRADRTFTLLALLLLCTPPLYAEEMNNLEGASSDVAPVSAMPTTHAEMTTATPDKKKCCGEKRREKREKAREKRRKRDEEARAKKEEARKKKEEARKRREDKKQQKKEKTKGRRARKPRAELKPTQDVIEELYAGVTGYNIPKEEVDIIKAKGGAPTYGEIKYHSLKTILDDIPKGHKKGAFYDFGSGVGKVVVQAYLDVPLFKKTVGWEISPQRYNDAQNIVSEMKKRDLVDKKRTIEFKLGDFLEAPIDDAKVIYMCSTCYSDECMTQLTEKFSKLKKGLLVITLKPLPNYKDYGFELNKEYTLPMTWWHATKVYVYELRRPVKESKIKKEKQKQQSNKTLSLHRKATCPDSCFCGSDCACAPCMGSCGK